MKLHKDLSKSINEIINDGDRILTKEEILSKVTELDIIQHYLGEISLKKNYVNPIRPGDTSPSGRFYKNSSTNKITFIDFADKNFNFDCFTLVMKGFNLSFTEALSKIVKDLNIKFDGTFDIKKINKNSLGQKVFNDLNRAKTNSNTELKKNYDFIVKERGYFNKFDLKYWNQFNITEQILNKFNVKPVFKCYIKYLDTNKTSLIYNDNIVDPCYAYEFIYKNNIYYKLYRPLAKNKKYKWKSNINNSIIQGFSSLEYNSKLLIITSSLKDAMTLSSLGYEAIAPQSESSFIDIETLKKLKFIYKYIVLFYDYDTTGIKQSNIIKENYKDFNIKTIFTNDNNLKDISDYIKEKGVIEGKKLLVNELKKHKIKIKTK